MRPDQGAARLAVRRLVNRVDFERLLSAGGSSRSTHFALHHVNGEPSRPSRAVDSAKAADLSTGPDRQLAAAVDKVPPALWLGCMAPKRHARRAVTRNLLKRQMRGAAERHAEGLAPGLWLIRLRMPFAIGRFPSARSAALALAVRTELDALLVGAGRSAGRPAVR